MANQNVQKQIKIGATLLVLGALVLQGMQMAVTLPVALQVLARITKVILAIHAVEGLVAAVLIFRYKLKSKGSLPNEPSSMLMAHLPESLPLAVLKAGLYVFFVGTVGLSEIIKEMKPSEGQLVQ